MGLLRPAVLLTILLLCVSSVCVHVKGEVKESGGKKITTKTEKTVNGTKTTEVEREPIGKHMEKVKTTITEVTPEETIVTVIKEVYVDGKLLTTEMSFSKSKNKNVTRNETQTVITSSKSGSKSATAISSSIPAVLISSVVFLYLYNSH
eukprot:Tbor_TRINITY_DN5459_c0_g1::TRINITY_DN5459_c0_g1_i6::g.24563::m.24563